MKIGITGAAGYIGSSTTSDTIKGGHDVIPIDNFYIGKIREIEGEKIINVDITNIKNLERAFRDCDVIIHLAAIPGMVNCKKTPDLAYQTNIVGTQNVAWICYKYKIPLIFMSTMAVYGNPRDPIREDDPKSPAEFYGLSKLMGMRIVKLFSKNNFPSIIFILGNVYGEHLINGEIITKQTVVNRFVSLIKENKPLTVYKPGTQKRDFVHVKDVSRALLHAVEILADADKAADNMPRVYNLASGKNYSILEIADMSKKIASEEGYQADIKLLDNPRNETIFDSFNVDVSKLKNELNFRTRITIEETIREML